MAAYLTANRPARDQWYHRRNRPLTGCTVLHTAENVLDTVGPDTGAEAVANFIRTRTTPGSYHDLVDSDSGIHLVEYEHGAYHDGTGSNNWALSLSFACRASDWRTMGAERRAGFLQQGAKAFARQQAWRKANGAPLTAMRLITRAQSEAGMSGFTFHGYRDPGRRTDPGTTAPNLFPMTEFLAACRAEIAGTTTEEDSLPTVSDVWGHDVGGEAGVQPAWAVLSQARTAAQTAQAYAARAVQETAGLRVAVDKLADAVARQQNVDPAALKAAVREAIAESVVSVDVNVTGP